MGAKRQKTQQELAFADESWGEAPGKVQQGFDAPKATCATEGPAATERLMEEVCARVNLKKALARVRSNKGSPGDTTATAQRHLEAMEGVSQAPQWVDEYGAE